MRTSKFTVKYFELIRIFSAVIIGFLLALIFLCFVSDDPINAIKTFILGPFESKRRFFNVIELAIPLLFTSLGPHSRAYLIRKCAIHSYFKPISDPEK